MTESSIGGRKNRMAKDHLFVVYAIVNDVVNGNNDLVEIKVTDLEKAFH